MAVHAIPTETLMPTVDKELADRLVARNGRYADDDPVYSIIEYDNAWGGVGYGINYTPHNRYTESEYVRNPRVYWERKDA